jgi:hypothetical protein
MSLREKDKRERIAENDERKRRLLTKRVLLRYFVGFISLEKGKLRLGREFFFNLIFIFQLIWGFWLRIFVKSWLNSSWNIKILTWK